MFDFQDIHLRALLKILNFVNQEFLLTSSKTRTPVRGPPNRPGRPSAASKAAAKTLLATHPPPQTTIETIDARNRQLIVESILNCIQYFDQHFKYNYKFVVLKTDDKLTKIQKWLQNYYAKEFLDDIDFSVIVKEAVKQELNTISDNSIVDEIVNKITSNDNNTDITEISDNRNDTNGDNMQQMLSETDAHPAQDMPSLEPIIDSNASLETPPESQPPDDPDLTPSEPLDTSDPNPTATAAADYAIKSNAMESQTICEPIIDKELEEKIVYNLELILLLVVIVLYKVRNLFPKLLDYLDFAWIYLSEFESRLESEIRVQNLIELLQSEFTSQRSANRSRAEVLTNEIIQLNAMIDNLDKQYQEETKELIYLQTAAIIGHNNTSANCRQLSKIMNIKTGGAGREAKLYSCPECGKNFKNGYKLNRHRYVHKDPSEKPYMCDWPGCGYRSIANNDLNRHRMIHTGEKPYQCDQEGCERKYSRPDKLSHHKRVAHNKDPVNKPFACDWPGCGYRSLANADLLRHQYIHTGERPYKCDYGGCDKAFSRPDKLRNHKDKSRHNVDELLSLDAITAAATAIDTSTSDISPSTAISIADCVPQAIQWS